MGIGMLIWVARIEFVDGTIDWHADASLSVMEDFVDGLTLSEYIRQVDLYSAVMDGVILSRKAATEYETEDADAENVDFL